MKKVNRKSRKWLRPLSSDDGALSSISWRVESGSKSIDSEVTFSDCSRRASYYLWADTLDDAVAQLKALDILIGSLYDLRDRYNDAIDYTFGQDEDNLE